MSREHVFTCAETAAGMSDNSAPSLKESLRTQNLRAQLEASVYDDRIRTLWKESLKLIAAEAELKIIEEEVRNRREEIREQG